MDVIKINNAIDALTKLIPVPEEKKTELITRFSSLSETEVIKELSQIVYRVLGNNEELYNYSLEVIRNINPEICPPVEEMKARLNRMF